MKDAHTGHIHSDMQKKIFHKVRWVIEEVLKIENIQKIIVYQNIIRACRVDNDIKNM